MAKGLVVVASSPSSPEMEDRYNAWYDDVHVPEVCSLPGFGSGERFRVRGDGPAKGGHSYVAIYSIEADDLDTPVAALAARSAAGGFTMSDAFGTDPAPVLTVYEQLG
jgi:hypothetical protein